MRVFAVSAVSMGVLAALAPMSAMGTGKPVTTAGGVPITLRKPRAAGEGASVPATHVPVSTFPVTAPVANPAITNPALPAFDFPSASMGEKIIYLSSHGEHKAAVEHFFAMPNDAAKLAEDVVNAYATSIAAHVTFVAPEGATWDSFSDAEKVRAFWVSGKYDDVIALYESSAPCKGDSKATAAFLDAKLKKAVQASVESHAAV